MTAHTIRELVRFLPKDPKQPQTDRTIAALHNPAFGWLFVKALVKEEKPFPPMVREQTLREAFYWIKRGNKSERFEQAVGITKEPFFKAKVDALLLTKLDMARIAELTSMPKDVLEAYGILFWNVRDRREDKEYISSIVYLGSRLEMIDSEESTPPLRLSLLRAAYDHGHEELLKLTAMTPASESGHNPNARRNLEDALMSRAVDAARYGKFNQGMRGILKQALSKPHTEKESENCQDRIGLHRIGDAVIADLQTMATPAMKAIMAQSEKDFEIRKAELDAQD